MLGEGFSGRWALECWVGEEWKASVVVKPEQVNSCSMFSIGLELN